jgi:regulator of sirC expression with transglutaminase-like and TPR domain
MRTGLKARAQAVAELAASDRLAEAALTFSGFAYPGLDPAPYLDRLEQMARSVKGSTHLSLRKVISIIEGIGGNVDDYNNPENSFLHRVLETRKGLPITVAAIWIEVGRRVGIEMQGVGLPGHFLVYAGGQLVDPFHYGEAIGFDEAASLVAAGIGGPPRLDPSWLEPVETTPIVVRMLTNLDHRYRESGDLDQLDWVSACLEALS